MKVGILLPGVYYVQSLLNVCVVSISFPDPMCALHCVHISIVDTMWKDQRIKNITYSRSDHQKIEDSLGQIKLFCGLKVGPLSGHTLVSESACIKFSCQAFNKA